VKCKTIREIRCDVNCHPAYVSKNMHGRDVIAPGVVICKDEFPLADCVRLVLNGLAIPDDEECRLACNRTESQLQAARDAMDRMLNPLVEDEEDDDTEDEEDE
jgi:hypothetical protein